MLLGNILLIILNVFFNIHSFTQMQNKTGRIDAIIKNISGIDSIEIIIYSNNKLMNEYKLPSLKKSTESYSLEIRSGVYDVLIQVDDSPFLLFKDVTVKTNKISFLILNLSGYDKKSKKLHLRKFTKNTPLTFD